MIQLKPRYRQGFSIIQVVVSIVIFGMTMSTTVSLVGGVVRQNVDNKNRITAIYLAQECVELARNVRDSAWKQYYPWDCAFDTVGAYTIEPFSITNRLLQPDTYMPLCQKDFGVHVTLAAEKNIFFLNSNRYTHTEGGENTGFSRVLKRKDDILFSCEVQWGENEVVEIPFYLTDWNQQ